MQSTRFPIHVCIGAPRTGTTWLFNNLRDSSQVFLPCVKEVRYWWGPRSDAEKGLVLANQRMAQKGNADQLAWLDRWARTGEVSGPAYLKLMVQCNSPSLDISPIYNTMPQDRIGELSDALPKESRILLILRNPFERNSSAVRLHGYMHGRFRGAMADATLLAFMDRWFQRRHRDYVKTIRLWKHVFGERFGVFYYDDLKDDPEGFLQQVAEFMGLTAPYCIGSKKAHLFYNTDRTRGRRQVFPDLTSVQKWLVAGLSLADAQAYAEIDPDMSARWSVSIQAEYRKSSVGSDIPKSDPVDVLLRMTENLGETCDFSLFQRSRGYNPASLLRWSQTPINTVIKLLGQPHKEITCTVVSPRTLGPQADEFVFRSDLADQDRSIEPQTPLAGTKGLQILRERFIFQLRHKPCLYVVTVPTVLPLGQQRVLLDHLRSYNRRHCLLCVFNGADVGFQTRQEGLYQAQLPLQQGAFTRFAWEKLFEKLIEQDDLGKMIDKMFE